jgi:hypothetical protein
MPWAMIAFLSLAQSLDPQMVQLEFQTKEACLTAGQQFAQTMIAVGFCVDKLTGDSAVWMSGPSAAKKPPGPEDQQ